MRVPNGKRVKNITISKSSTSLTTMILRGKGLGLAEPWV
jgi:hypothetical protein